MPATACWRRSPWRSWSLTAGRGNSRPPSRRHRLRGRRFGHQTQVQYFRDRWECSGIGTVIFALSAAMLVPYMIISIIGGGTVLADISRQGAAELPLIPYWMGCLIVTLVVTLNVFFG